MSGQWSRRLRRSRGAALAAGEEADVGTVFPLQPCYRVKNTFHAGQVNVFELGWGIGDVQTRDAQDRRMERVKSPFLHPGSDLSADTGEALGLLDHHATASLADRGNHRLIVEGHDGAQVDDLDR